MGVRRACADVPVAEKKTESKRERKKGRGGVQIVHLFSYPVHMYMTPPPQGQGSQSTKQVLGRTWSGRVHNCTPSTFFLPLLSLSLTHSLAHSRLSLSHTLSECARLSVCVFLSLPSDAATTLLASQLRLPPPLLLHLRLRLLLPVWLLLPLVSSTGWVDDLLGMGWGPCGCRSKMGPRGWLLWHRVGTTLL